MSTWIRSAELPMSAHLRLEAQSAPVENPAAETRIGAEQNGRWSSTGKEAPVSLLGFGQSAQDDQHAAGSGGRALRCSSRP